MLLDNKLIHIFEKHEKEDELLMGPYFEQTVLGDFENAEAILECFADKDLTNGMLHLFGPEYMKKRIGQIPTRIEHEFSARKHTTHVRPYYHRHNYYEILLVLQGKCVHYIPEEKQPVLLDESSICLLAPGRIHALDAAGSEDLIVKVRIPIPLFHAAAKNLETEIAGKLLEEGVWIRQKSPKPCLQLWQMLLRTHLLEQELGTGVIQSYLTLILREYSKEPEREKGQQISAQVTDYIAGSPADANLVDCAASLGYSSGYLSRMIRKQTGAAFREILQKYRLQKAVERLTMSDEPIEQLGRSLGYKSTAGFYKSFTKVYGMTPGAYKKMFS